MGDSLLSMIVSAAILAAAAGLPAWVVYRRIRNTPLLPVPEPWLVPWNGPGVFVAFVFFFCFATIGQVLLNDSGFFQQLYGPDFPRTSRHDGSDPLLVQADHVRTMWGYTIAIPIQLVSLVLGFKLFSGATMSQMGLGCGRLGQNYLLGYLGWLVLTPTSFAIFALARMLTLNPQNHPLLDLGPWNGNLELIAFAIQAALLAPINEELLFRGLLLAWLLQPARPNLPERAPIMPPLLPERRSDACVFCALLIAFWLQKPALDPALRNQQTGDIVASLAPFLFVALLTPFYLLLPYSQGLQRRLGFSYQALRGWFATSILFAAIHSSVWPSPVPLLALALGMGWLTIRTRSIIPAIIVHMLFNGVAVVYVWLGGGS